MAFDAPSTEQIHLNGTATRLPWHRPQCPELPPAEAKEVRARFDRIDRANDPLADLTPKQIFFDCIWLSEERTATKIMLLCIARFFDDNARSSSMSYTQVARECSLHEVTAKKIAGAIRDRWLKISVSKGYYVPGKGAQNLYHGICPPDLVEQLRERKRTGGSIAKDEKTAKAAGAVAERVMSGVASDYPADDRGSPRFVSGLPQTTRTQIDSDDEKKEDQRVARANEIVLTATLEDQSRAVTAQEADDPLASPEQVATFLDLASKWCPVSIADTTESREKNLMMGLVGKARSLSPDIVISSLTDTLLDMHGMQEGRQKTFAAFVRYFWKTFDTKADANFKAAVQRRTHVALAEAKIGTELQIGQTRVAGLQKSIESGIARRAASPAARSPDGRHQTEPDGRVTFAPGVKALAVGYGVNVLGQHCNDLMREVPSATIDDVEAVLVEASGALSKRKATSRYDLPEPSLQDAVNKVRSLLEARIAHREHGTPEQLCRGEVAETKGIGQAARWRSEWLAIGQHTVDACLAKYPKAEEWQVQYLWDDLRKQASKMRKTYGAEQQQALEAELESKIAGLHAEAEAKEARLREVAEEGLRRDAESRAHAGMTPSRWNALTNEERLALVQSEFASLKEAYAARHGLKH